MRNKLTENEIKYIKENYNNLTVKEIASNLNRCTTTIYKTINKLKLSYENRDGKVWTKEETKYLLSNYLVKTNKEIAEHLHRSEKSIAGKAYNLKIAKNTNSKNWTDEELNYLKENINKINYDEIIEHLQRSPSAVYNKVYELQLIPEKYKGYRKVKMEQIEFIIANCDKMTDSQLSKIVKISEEAISEIRKKNKINKSNKNQIHDKTYIEQIIIENLNLLNIPYEFNKQNGMYTPDFQIIGSKKLIEIMGDYYHCNPYIYQNGPKNTIQLRQIIKDYYKKCYYLSQGYEILEIWEKDINENIDLVVEKIKQFTAVCGQGSQKSSDN